MAARLRPLLAVLAIPTVAISIGWSQEPPTVTAARAKSLTVDLASGRSFTGVVDAATSDECLMLRFMRGEASLKRPIEWSRVVRASVDGVEIEPNRVRETALTLRSQSPGARNQSPRARSQLPEAGRETAGDRRPGAAPGGLREVQASTESPISQPRVTSATFDVRLANWDGDVETDGLLVDIYPISDDGFVVPTRGAIEVELYAPQKRAFQDAPLSGGDTLERVERWTRAINVDDFGRDNARLKLPFGAVHPEFDLDWIGVGLVHVRLVVPGEGVFEDSVDGLRIRPYAPLRDRLEMNTGRRFLPTERVGRHD